MLAHTTSWMIATFSLCMVSVPVLRVLAMNTDLTDKPSGRKTHQGEVPLIGGVAIFLSVALAAMWFSHTPLVFQFVLLSLPLILIGVLDDLYEVHPSVRIVVQIVVSIAMIYQTDVRIEQIGDIFGQGAVQLGPVVSPIFTTFCVIGVINAINMLDGCDGLAGSIALVTIFALTGVSALNGDTTSLAVAAMLGGGIVAFLFYNMRVFGAKFRIFLGDAGSMFLGFSLVWLFVRLSQVEGAAGLSPVAAGWILGLPLLDVISVLVGRIRRGVSPFTAGRDHLHHLLLDSGYSSNVTVATLAAIHIVLVGIGLLINAFEDLEPVAFWVFVALVVAHHFWTPRIVESWKNSSVTT